MAATVPPATYELIGTWIDQQRHAPTPLNDRLRVALFGLEDALRAETMCLVEPELDDANWIGLLQEYRAAYPFNGSRDVLFTDSAIDPSGRGPLRWKCEVRISEHPDAAFPPVNDDQPTFARKKDAKKYAAKCAVDWLRAKGYMPPTGAAKFPKGVTSPVQQQQLMQQMQQQQQQRQMPSTNPFHFSSTSVSSPSASISPFPANNIMTSPFNDSQPSARNQVAELCKELGLPAPSYRTESTGKGFFTGWAEFSDFNLLLPFDADCARVRDVLGDKAAKELVAENLLTALRAEKQSRDTNNARFLARQA